jgi:hypothetical protein
MPNPNVGLDASTPNPNVGVGASTPNPSPPWGWAWIIQPQLGLGLGVERSTPNFGMGVDAPTQLRVSVDAPRLLTIIKIKIIITQIIFFLSLSIFLNKCIRNKHNYNIDILA